MLILMIKRV